MTWEATSDDYTLEPHVVGVDAAAGTSALVVVANNQQWASSPPPGEARTAESAVWLSRDGITWTRAVNDDDISSAGFMTSVIVTDTGIIAAGQTVTLSADGQHLENIGAVVWVGTPRS